ncbi:hypothetical protein GGR51DRAFT_535013, partial [Nemania sp. FL0031]
MSPVLSYSPSLFCSSSMIKPTSISTTTSYNYTVTLTAGRVSQGNRGEDVGYISSTPILSTDLQTTHAEATFIVLVRQVRTGLAAWTPLLPTESPTTSPTTSPTKSPIILIPPSTKSPTSAPTTPRTGISTTTLTTPLTTPPTTVSTTVKPGLANTSSSQLGLNSTIIVSSVLGGAVFILFIALAYFLARYRRGRALTLSNESYTGKVQEHETNRAQQNSSDGTSGLWNLKPELDSTATRAELEGITVDHQGPGIYVVKPELEGTAVGTRLLGVFIRGKAELEGSGPRETTDQLTIRGLGHWVRTDQLG